MRRDEWLDDDRDNFTARRSVRKTAGSMFQQFLLKLLLTLASIGAVFWGYTYFTTKLLTDVSNISAQAQKGIQDRAKEAQTNAAQAKATQAKPAPIRHDEAIAQFRQQQQMELVQRSDKREAAWQRFFKPSKNCVNDASVECANAYIKAKRAFDEQYRD